MSVLKLYQLFITLLLFISIPHVYTLHSNVDDSIGQKSTRFDKSKQPETISTTKNVGMNSDAEGFPDEPERLYLPSISILTFTQKTYTTPRRTDPQLQLQCTGGTAHDDVSRYPTRVDCFNRGIDQAAKIHTVRWKCITPLHRGVQITKWNVHCEGWSSDFDLFIVDGSCWLEYQLDYHSINGKDVSTTEEVENNILWSLQALGILLIIVASILIVVKLAGDIRSGRNQSAEVTPILYEYPQIQSGRVTPPMSQTSSRHTSRNPSRNNSPAVRVSSGEGTHPSFQRL